MHTQYCTYVQVLSIAIWALLANEVRTLIFDDLTAQGDWQRPVMVKSGRSLVQPARARHGHAMHEYCFENLRNPARARRAKAMRQFPTGQVDSILNLI